jgi:hypothetical protein
MSSYTYSDVGPECPHCKHRICADEPSMFDNLAYVQDDCPRCGKAFKVRVFTQTTWECEPLETCDDGPSLVLPQQGSP